ncbi:MAG: sulfite exporter TauE/SafE family protein [Acetobacteraceae bacterium]|nr:sulfite exporter TauE/SafE family protein [Acetobacteraceae bacterium]
MHDPGLAALLLNREMVLAALATALAGVMRGYAGFGTAITLAPIYSMLWSPREGVPIMLAMEALIAGSLVPGVWRLWTRRVTLPMAATACSLLPFGAYALVAVEGQTLRRVIGGLVLGFAVLLASGWRYHGRRPLWLNLVVGAVSGIMKGATGMSGPPVILYLLSGPEAARQHRANLIVFFGMVSLVAMLPVFWYGLAGIAVLVRVAALLPVLLLTVRVGVSLFGRLPERWFRATAYVFLFAVGLMAVAG